jgi:hypothetical protein
MAVVSKLNCSRNTTACQQRIKRRNGFLSSDVRQVRMYSISHDTWLSCTVLQYDVSRVLHGRFIIEGVMDLIMC